jgi:hypothetical protein
MNYIFSFALTMHILIFLPIIASHNKKIKPWCAYSYLLLSNIEKQLDERYRQEKEKNPDLYPEDEENYSYSSEEINHDAPTPLKGSTDKVNDHK